MCLTGQSVAGLDEHNWDGDYIVHKPIVPSSRYVPGYRRQKRYDTDPREFLRSSGNAVIAKVLHEDVKAFCADIPTADWDKFRRRDQGCFDHRVDVITAFVSQRIVYEERPSRGTFWLYPEETIHVKKGDCEDRALLIAALLLVSGVSSYNLRIALGKVHITAPGESKLTRDHVWVMYKDEGGSWQVIEPTQLTDANIKPQRNVQTSKKKSPKTNKKKARRKQKHAQVAEVCAVKYEPYFVFNDTHLWGMRSEKPLDSSKLLSPRRRWASLDPTFTGELHRTILNDALAGLAPRYLIDALNRRFSRAFMGLFGPILDSIDSDFGNYDPRDHFDNGYIDDGWDRVQARLAAFKSDHSNLDAFASATHAIADFYAHSSWGQFAKIVSSGDFQPRLASYDPLHPTTQLDRPIVYESESGFDLTTSLFTFNKRYSTTVGQQRADLWKGKIISGRYAQRSDTQPGLLNQVTEGLTYIPRELERRSDYSVRGSLPHHNEIAVDEKAFKSTNRLYQDSTSIPGDRQSYHFQFLWRQNAATHHIQKAFKDNW